MKIKNEEEIEQLADDYKPSLSHEECLDRDDLEFIENESGDQFVSLNEVDRVARFCHFRTFQKAYSQAQSDLLESASEGFEEWELDVNWPNAFRDHRSAALGAWQACSLYHAKLIKEKDERIKELTYYEEMWEFLAIDHVMEEYDYSFDEEYKKVESIKSKYGLDKQESKV